MKTTLPAILFAIFAPIAIPQALADINDCQPLNRNGHYIRTFTNYAPSAGGINGHCGTSASGRDACQYSMEDYLGGSAPMVMGAVPQKGETAKLFGGVYKALPLEERLGKNCIKVFAGDRYGTGSNGKQKMDIVTDKPRSKSAPYINASRGYLFALGRGKDVKGNRKVNRDPAAVSQPVKRKKITCRSIGLRWSKKLGKCIK